MVNKNTFVNKIENTYVPPVAKAVKPTSTPAYTLNGAVTLPHSGNAIVELFHLAGASRGKNIIPQFDAALNDNVELALRVALWVRDVRGGAGERETFRSFLKHLEATRPEDLRRVLPRVPELGRWDDILVLETNFGKTLAYFMIRDALAARDGLCAKWMPRKGKIAVELRMFLGLSPKTYRKTLVELTKVVETQMCSNQWNDVNYSHVPSVAHARYRKAFWKHSPERYKEYVDALSSPTKVKGVKINAGAVYPHDLVKTFISHYYGNASVSVVERDSIRAQWKALPDFVGEGSFIPMIDVSGSMFSGSSNVRPIDVSMSLGVYLAERNKSAFKNIWLTFSSQPSLEILKGEEIDEKIMSMDMRHWDMSTNIEGAFNTILNHAVKNKVPQEDMPQSLIVLSDMEFNSNNAGKTNFEVAKAAFAKAGYTLPNLVFWNLNARAGNSPVSYTESGTALVSGFSPSIMKSVLSKFNTTPIEVVLETIMSDRYRLAA